MTSIRQDIGTLNVPGHRPQDVTLTLRTRPVLTKSEQDAGLITVNGDYKVGDIRRYGAELDGVTDDTKAVSDWLDVGMAGQELSWDFGTANCATWATKSITSNVYIKGSTRGVVKGTTSLDFIKPEGGSILIDGLAFDNWLNVIKNVTTDAGTTDRLEVTNCDFSNVAEYCIRMERPFNRISIIGNYFGSLDTGAILTGTNSFALQDDWNRVTITNNKCVGVSNSAAGNCHFALILAKNAVISNNYVESISSNTGEAWGIYTKCRYASVTGNVVNGVTSTASTAFAINLKGAPRADTSDTQGFSVTCTGNTCIGSGEGVGINLQCDDQTATGNHVENFIVGIQSTAADEGVTVSSNRVIGANTSNNTWGVNVTGDTDYVVVNGNNISTCENAIRFTPATAVAHWKADNNLMENCSSYAFEVIGTGAVITDLSIQGNQVDNALAFGLFDNVDGLLITGNKWSNITGTASYPIRLNSVAGCQNVTIKGNQPWEIQTTNNSTTNIALIDVDDESTLSIDATIVGMKTDGTDRAKYKIGALFYRDGGAATQQGATHSTITAIESDSTWNALYGTSVNAVTVRVLGAAATTINWKADLEIVTTN